MKKLHLSFHIVKYNIIVLIFLILISLNATGETESNWPMFHQNSQHTGYQSSPGSGNISNYGIIWVKNFDYTIYGEPAVANIDGIGDKEIIFGNDDGKIYCLNPSGDIIWDFKCDSGTSHGIRISSTPLLFNLTGNSPSHSLLFKYIFI